MPAPTPLEDFEFDLRHFLVLRSALDLMRSVNPMRLTTGSRRCRTASGLATHSGVVTRRTLD